MESSSWAEYDYVKIFQLRFVLFKFQDDEKVNVQFCPGRPAFSKI